MFNVLPSLTPKKLEAPRKKTRVPGIDARRLRRCNQFQFHSSCSQSNGNLPALGFIKAKATKKQDRSIGLYIHVLLQKQKSRGGIFFGSSDFLCKKKQREKTPKRVVLVVELLKNNEFCLEFSWVIQVFSVLYVVLQGFV